jgi:hypothetical protein
MVSLGDGKGNFTAARNYVGAGQSNSIGVADFNGDGKPDFVTANNDVDSTTVYLNDGSGSFGFPQGIYAGVPNQGVINAPISDLSFADMNGDGKIDAFFLDAGYSGEYYATSFLNDGSGRFTEPISTDIGAALVTNVIGDYRLGDFRGTGHQDLISIGQSSAYSESGQFILFSPGNGDGTFGASKLVLTPGASGALTTGDFNGDGKLDFVAVDSGTPHTLTPFLGNGDGTFRSTTAVTFNDKDITAGRVFTGDFNHDGKSDVLVFTTANGYWTTASTVWEFDGNGDGTFQPARQLFTDFQPFALADFNGDGLADIARYDFMWPDGTTENEGPAKFTTYLGQTDGTFEQSSSAAPYAGVPRSVYPFMQFGDPLSTSIVGNFKGTGGPDEVAFQGILNGPNYAQILAGNGDGTFTPTYDVFPFYLYDYPQYARDLDGDGIADMLEVDAGSSSFHVLKGGRAPALQIALDDEIVSGNSSCGWVYPNLVSASDRMVTLSSTISGVVLPASITLPANSTGVHFCYTLASTFNSLQVFDVSAHLDGDTATAYASQSYLVGFNEAVTPSSPPAIYAGQSTAPLTITLDAAQGYTSTVALHCENMHPGDNCTFGSSNLMVSPTSAATTTVVLNTAPGSTAYGSLDNFTIVASDGTVTRRQTVGLYVTDLIVEDFGASFLASSPGSASSQIGITGIPPYTVSCTGLPSGATCAISGAALPYPSSSGLTVTVTVASTVASGSYPFQIVTTSGPDSVTKSETLQVAGYSLQGPPASTSWAIPGSSQNTTVTTQADSTLAGSTILIACSLDAGGTCSGGYAPLSATPAMTSLTVTVPAGTALGQHVLTVTSTLGASSRTYTFPFYVSDFSGTLSASSVSLTPGATTTINTTLNATAGLIDAISLGCSGASEITCTFSQQEPQLNAGTPTTSTITLQASESASVLPATAPFARGFVIAVASAFPIGLFALRRRSLPKFLILILSAFLMFGVASCGGSSQTGSSGGGGGGTPQSTTYSVTVTGTAAGTSIPHTLGVVQVTVSH